MPLFFYSGTGPKGHSVRGTVDALSVLDARDSLKGMNIDVEELHEATMEERNAENKGVLHEAEPPWREPIVFETIEEQSVNTQPLTTVEPAPNEETKEQKAQAPKKPPPKKKTAYHPLIDTLRLYAGWLLAWYLLVYALGAYQHTRTLPFSVPYVEALLPPYSSIVFSCTIAAFLFLLLTSIHKALRGGAIRGASLSLLGIALFFLYTMNL